MSACLTVRWRRFLPDGCGISLHIFICLNGFWVWILAYEIRALRFTHSRDSVKMTESEGMMQEKASNSCCAALNKKHTKLLEKYKKLEDIKHKLRDCLDMVSQRYDSIEKENQALKKELEELKVEINIWKEEKEKETGIRADLESHVSALKDEIQCLKQRCHSGSQEGSHQLQEHLNLAEKDVKHLRVLLDEEREKTSLAKQNFELEKRKAGEALKKLEVETKRATDAQNLANVQKKKMEESNLMLEKLKMDADSVKSILALEKKKTDKALKDALLEKKKANEAQMLANKQMEKAEENRLMLEKLKKENESVQSMLALEKSKSDVLVRNAEQEKEKAHREKETADLAVASVQELRKTAEMNLKMAIFEKDRADDLNKKLEEAVVKRLDEKLEKCICLKKSSEAHADGSSNFGVVICANNSSGEVPKSDSSASKITEAHKRIGIKKKKRPDHLTEHAEIYKLTEHVSFDSPLKCSVITETDTVKLLRKQLKLEKMLVKHAKKAFKVEAFRNNMLQKELLNIKQESLFLQQRVYLLEKSIHNCCGAMPPSVKIGADSCSRESMYSTQRRSHSFSGIDSRLEVPYRGSNKKMLQPSAINSSSAFFSEPTFMGSQERDNLFVSSSASMGKGISNLKPSMSKKQHDHNEIEPNARLDSSRKSSPKIDNKLIRLGSPKRDSVIDAVDSVKDLHLEAERLHKCTSEKLTLSHGVFDGQHVGTKERSSKEMPCTKIPRPSKRKKTSSGGRQSISHNLKYSEGRKSQSNKDYDHFLPSARPGSSMVSLEQCLEAGKCHEDYMKLLDLDDDTEENLYRNAMATPLSPSLPQVEFAWDDKPVVDNNEIFVNKSSIEDLLIVSDNLPSSSRCPIDDSTPSKVLEKENNFDCSRNINPVMEDDACYHILHDDENRRISDASDYGETEIANLLDRENASSSGGLFKNFIVCSDSKERSSISRILQTVMICKKQCAFLHSAGLFFEQILQALSNAENVSMREKVCVLLSMILHAVDEFGQESLLNDPAHESFHALDLASVKIRSALSDPVLSRMFMESIDFFEFLSVVEDFILQRKLLVYQNVPPQFEVPSIPKINIFLNGETMTLHEVAASSYLLVYVGNVLATVCSTVDQIGFICDMSCNILIGLKSDPALLLAILHVFARVCGSRIFTFQQCSMSMKVVKSIAVFLEKQHPSVTSVAEFPSSVVEKPSENWCCRRGSCPFSKNEISVEDVSVLLLENFQNHVTSRAEGTAKFENLVKVTLDPSQKDEEATCLGVADEDFLDLVDILSLIEIVASFKEWQWTFSHIVVRLCEYLDSHLSSEHSVVTILLLGQLGRLGIDACGYDDKGVKQLQQRLSAFVTEASSFKKLSLLHQFATMNSLLGLTPFKFNEVVGDEVDDASAAVSHSIPCKFIKKWFFQLTREQQSLLKLHHTSAGRHDAWGPLLRWSRCCSANIDGR